MIVPASPSQPGTGRQAAGNCSRPWIPPGDAAVAAVLAALCLGCFANSLLGYFHNEDSIHIGYVYRALKGHPELLWLNFVSNWVQYRSVHLFYRPLVELSLALDFLFWKANPFGYHLSNLLFHLGSSIFLFLLARRLLQGAGLGEGRLPAAFAAALFAVFPLHSEVVAWPVARTDGLSSLFYLVAFWAHVKADQESSRRCRVLSLATFVLALLSKEMAVSLPATLAVYGLIFGQGTLGQRAGRSLRGSALYWILLACYLAARTLALGSPVGGYSGAIGGLFSASACQRLFGSVSLWKLVFPFNEELIPVAGRLSLAVHFLYLALCAVILIRARLSAWPPTLIRLIAFAALWFLLALAPCLPVFYVTGNLIGSRFLYLPSAAWCLLLTLTVAVWTEDERSRGRRLQRALAYGVLAALAGCFALATVENNLAWVEASAGIRSFVAAVTRSLAGLPPGRQLVILNPPRNCKGGLMFWGLDALQAQLRQPFRSNDVSDLVAATEPVWFGDPDLVNASRVAEMARSGRYSFCRWSAGDRKLVPVTLSLSPAGRPAREPAGPAAPRPACLPLPVMAHARVPGEPGDLDEFACSLGPQAASIATPFVELELQSQRDPSTAAAGGASLGVSVSWRPLAETSRLTHQDLTLPLVDDGRPHLYRFPVFQHRSWLLAGRKRILFATVPAAGRRNVVLSWRLSSGDCLVPTLEADAAGFEQGADSILHFKGGQGLFHYDAGRVAGATGVVVEISEPYFAFDHFAGTFCESRLSPHTIASIRMPHVTGTFQLPARLLPQAAWYQVRVAASSGSGEMIGYTSDPLQIAVSPRQLLARLPSPTSHAAVSCLRYTERD